MISPSFVKYSYHPHTPSLPLLLLLFALLLQLVRVRRGFLILCIRWTLLASLQLLQELCLLLELFLPFFLLLALEVLLLGEFFNGLDLLTPRTQEVVSHLFLSIGLGGFELLVSLLVALPAVGVVAEAGPRH